MEPTTGGVNKFLVPIAVVLAGLFIGGAVIWSNGHPTTTTGTTATTGKAPNVNIKDVSIADDPYIGNANAATIIAEWADYQCPFCKQFEVTTLPQIIQNYVATGKVKVVFKDFQFLGPDSDTAALWARAVWALYPNQFGVWRAAIYLDQPQENSLSATEYAAWLAKTTSSVAGLDSKKVAANVITNHDKYEAAIQADRAEGQKFGVNATPSFIIGTQLIAGAYPYANFQTAIDAVVK